MNFGGLKLCKISLEKDYAENFIYFLAGALCILALVIFSAKNYIIPLR
jgi:hypothetical protein